MRARQLAPARETAAAANLRQIVPYSLFSFRHCFPPMAGGAPALQFNGLTMHRKQVMMQEGKVRFDRAPFGSTQGELHQVAAATARMISSISICRLQLAAPEPSEH
jgi:hypothetical protein